MINKIQILLEKFDTFHIILYLVVCPLLLYNSIQQNNLILWICFFAILLFHLYKDIYQPEDWKIPSWTEPIGFCIGFALFYVSNNILVKLLGLLKMLAHIRQLIFKDNIYYFT